MLYDAIASSFANSPAIRLGESLIGSQIAADHNDTPLHLSVTLRLWDLCVIWLPTS